jgi:hypothetical protein
LQYAGEGPVRERPADDLAARTVLDLVDTVERLRASVLTTSQIASITRRTTTQIAAPTGLV